MTGQAPRRRRKRRRGEIVNINTSQLSFQEEEDVLIAVVEGDFDILSLPEIEPGLVEAAIESDCLLLNLDQVGYIDAAALALLERLTNDHNGLAVICGDRHLDMLSEFNLRCHSEQDQAIAALVGE